jgi:glycosyltransferase involved in cell wall biosynthesis
LTIRVTAFTKYDREAASTRQRLLQYVPALERAGFEIDYRPLLGSDYVRSLTGRGGYSRADVAKAYARRMRELLRGDVGDLVWVYAELFPYLPSAFETLAFRSGRPVVYDCDDAFFHQYDQSSRPLVRRALGGKLQPLMAGAAACACGNDYLEAYAARFCPNTIVLPTVVDTDDYKPHGWTAPDAPITIGWIGSPSTFAYLRPVLPLMRSLHERFGTRFRVVGAGEVAADAPIPGMDLVPWSEAREIAEVQAMDIGIMPLPDDLWARGKSGYKLIQYMACALPVVASPVGVNGTIVQRGVNGFLVDGLEQWREALEALIASPDLRRRLGQAGRERAVSHYSVQSQAPRFTALLAEAAAGGRSRR